MQNDHPLRIHTRLKIRTGLPDCVPYISVFFLLLIFFMMGSSFVQLSGIPVTLPETPVQRSQGVKKLVVTVDKSGKIYFNDIEMDNADRFKNRLIEVANTANGDQPTIILRADSRTDFGTVAKIMAAAEALKVNVFVLTAPPAEKPVQARTQAE